MMKRTLHVLSILGLAAALLGWLAPPAQASAAWCALRQERQTAARPHACCPASQPSAPMSPQCAWRCAHPQAALTVPAADTHVAPAIVVAAIPQRDAATSVTTFQVAPHTSIPAPPLRRYSLFSNYRC